MARAGIHVAPENPSQFADATVQLRDHPELCKVYGRNGRDFVVRNYDRRRLAESLEAALREVIGQPPRTTVGIADSLDEPLTNAANHCISTQV